MRAARRLHHLHAVGEEGFAGFDAAVEDVGAADRHPPALVRADGVVVAAVGIDRRSGRMHLARGGGGDRRLAGRRPGVRHRVRLAPERVVEMLRHAVLPVRRDVGEPHVLHCVVEVVGAGLRGAENLASLAVALPQEAAAGVGVRERRAVKVGRRAEAVLLVIYRLLVGDDGVALRQANRLAKRRPVSRVRLCCLVGGELGHLGRGGQMGWAIPAGGAGQDAARKRVGVDREDAVLVERFGDGVSHEERRSLARVGVGDLAGIGDRS